MDTRIVQIADVSVTPRPGTLLRAEQFVGNLERRIGRAVGLSQFGVNHIELLPGSISSLRHWHEGEDELVYVLSGTLLLVDDNGEHELTAGCVVGFPAGVPNAHHLKNTSAAPAAFLAVGTRKRGKETIHYPDDPQIGVSTGERDANGERIK